MTIQSINAYTPSKGADPKLDRKWATKEELHGVVGEIELLKEVCDTVFLVLVNGKEGISCLEYDNIKELLDDNFEDHEWLSVSTKLRKEYTLKGKDGNLQRKIPRKNGGKRS